MDEVIDSLRYSRRVTIGVLIVLAFMYAVLSLVASVGIIGLATGSGTWGRVVFWFIAVSGTASALATLVFMARIGNQLTKINKALRDFSQS